MDLAKRKVLVAGASGLIGRYLVEQLALCPDLAVVVCVRSKSKFVDQSGLVEIFYYESVTSESISQIFDRVRPDVVINLAGVVPKRYREASMYQLNVDLARVFAEASINAQVNLFIHFSTAHIYGTVCHYVVSEVDEPRPLGAYGLSKYEAENVLTNFAQRPDCHTRFKILRLAPVVGLRGDRRLNLLWSVVKLGLPLPLIGLTGLRSYATPSGILHSILPLLSNNSPQKIDVFNVADSRPLDLIEVFLRSRSYSKNVKFSDFSWISFCLPKKLVATLFQRYQQNFVISNVKISRLQDLHKKA